LQFTQQVKEKQTLGKTSKAAKILQVKQEHPQQGQPLINQKKSLAPLVAKMLQVKQELVCACFFLLY
jgi:hypothetical protein